MGKNRYGNVVCFDRTRVLLNYCPNRENDYIHANWIDTQLTSMPNKFVCTQVCKIFLIFIKLINLYKFDFAVILKINIRICFNFYVK